MRERQILILFIYLVPFVRFAASSELPDPIGRWKFISNLNDDIGVVNGSQEGDVSFTNSAELRASHNDTMNHKALQFSSGTQITVDHCEQEFSLFVCVYPDSTGSAVGVRDIIRWNDEHGSTISSIGFDYDNDTFTFLLNNQFKDVAVTTNRSADRWTLIEWSRLGNFVKKDKVCNDYECKQNIGTSEFINEKPCTLKLGNSDTDKSFIGYMRHLVLYNTTIVDSYKLFMPELCNGKLVGKWPLRGDLQDESGMKHHLSVKSADYNDTSTPEYYQFGDDVLGYSAVHEPALRLTNSYRELLLSACVYPEQQTIDKIAFIRFKPSTQFQLGQGADTRLYLKGEDDEALFQTFIHYNWNHVIWYIKVDAHGNETRSSEVVCVNGQCQEIDRDATYARLVEAKYLTLILGSPGFRGRMRDILLFNRVKPLIIYHLFEIEHHCRTEDPIAVYYFNDTLDDFSGHGHNLTVNGTGDVVYARDSIDFSNSQAVTVDSPASARRATFYTCIRTNKKRAYGSIIRWHNATVTTREDKVISMLNGYVYVDGYKIDQLLDKSKWYFLHWTHDETQGEGVSEKLCLDTNCTTIPSNTSIQAEMKVTFGNFSGLMKNAFLFNILLKPDYRVAMDMCHAYCPDDGFRLTNETKYSNDFGSSVLVNSSGVRFKKSNKHVYAYLSAPDGSLTLPNRCPEVFTLYVCFKPKNGSSNLKRSLVTWSTGSPNDPQIYSLDKNIGYLSHHPIKKFPTNDWNFIEWTKYYTNKERVCFDQKCTEINDGGVYNNGTNCNLVIGSGGYEGFVKNVYLFDKPLRVQNRWLRDVCTESHIHEARSRFPKMTLDELCELWTYGWPFAKPCHKGRFASGDVIKHQKFDLDVTYVEARKNCLALGMSLLNAAKCLNTEAMDDYPTEFWRHTANKEDNITDCSTFSKHATDDEFIKTTHPCDQKLPFVCIQSYYRFPSRTSTVLHDHSRRRRGNCIFPENDGEATYGCMFDPADCD